MATKGAGKSYSKLRTNQKNHGVQIRNITQELGNRHRSTGDTGVTLAEKEMNRQRVRQLN